MPGDGDRHGTAAHVSVDLAASTGTGVSAYERAATVRRLANSDARPEDFLRPGQVFPLARHVPKGWPCAGATPRLHWLCARPRGCPRWQPSAR